MLAGLGVLALWFFPSVSNSADGVNWPQLAWLHPPEVRFQAVWSQPNLPAPASIRLAPPWRRPPKTMMAARIHAEAIRRSGGEWVVVRLAALPVPAIEQRGPSPPRTTQADLERLLGEYRKAFEARDIDRLKQVWLMNPDERSTLEHVFSRARGIDLRIEGAKFKTEGNRGLLEFTQFLAVERGSPRPLSANARPQRALSAHDRYGAWPMSRRATR